MGGILMLAEARRLVAAGLSVIPIAANGTKAPAIPEWKTYQKRRASEDELGHWFGHERHVGLAIIGGAVSGGVECIDIDCAAAVATWVACVRAMGGTDLLGRLVVCVTPAGGRHIRYRHEGQQEGNQKLAMVIGDDERPHTAIETRGAGGYALCPPSPAGCHPTGRLYRLSQGDLAAIPVISADERTLLLDCARSQNEVAAMEPEHVIHGGLAQRSANSLEQTMQRTAPGHLYVARGSWEALLPCYGWTRVLLRGGVGYWRRPGKRHGVSATTNYDGSGYMIVFSTNAPPFLAGRAYNLFSAYGLLAHQGDFVAAGRSLYAAGYRDEQAHQRWIEERARSRTLSSLRDTMDSHLARRLAGATPSLQH